ncbi:alpha/beta fold hydrolase [Myxococcota bacterium]|nr:alpha/beta fold hydrolase [Myxococcota bacterium]
MTLEEHVHFVHADDGVRLAITEVVAPSAASPVGATLPEPRPVFVLVHGFAQNRTAYLGGALPEELVARGARVLLAELRGHGRSAHDPTTGPRAWTLATHLEADLPAILRFASQLAEGPVHYVGHSMGGMLGYALLGRGAPLASLVTFAAPVHLGRARPLLRLASLVALPTLGIATVPHVPMDQVLAALAPHLTATEARGLLRLVQRVTRLVNPAGGDPAALHAILATSDAESPRVLVELAKMALLGDGRVAGVDVVAALARAPIPVAAVLGSDDVFASRASVAVLEDPGARGPRMVVELPDALHVDVVAGHHAARIAATLWDFVRPDRAAAAGPSAPEVRILDRSA